MLDPKFKKKWTDALRSGDYTQGQHGLCLVSEEGAAYCCLGIAYELTYGEDSWVEDTWRTLDGSYWLRAASVNDDTSLFTPEGLTPKQADDLAEMNDEGKTFNELADYIDENF